MIELISNQVFVLITIAVVMAFGMLMMLTKWYKKAKPGEALIRKGGGMTRVSFSGLIVVPIIQELHRLDMTIRTIEVKSQEGNQAKFVTKNGDLIDFHFRFDLRPSYLSEDVVKVTYAFGCEKLNDSSYIPNFFQPKIEEAVRIVLRHFSSEELDDKWMELKEAIFNCIGKDLNGFRIEDMHIHYLNIKVELLHLSGG